MPKGRLYDREGIATMGRQNLETRWVEKLACYYLCVCLLSLIDAQRTVLSHEYNGTQPRRFNACHAERQMALFAYRHQFARDELVNEVGLLGLSPVHSPPRLKWVTILISTFCKIS